MHKNADGTYSHHRFLISRGSYLDTPDDCLSGWYVDHSDTATIDRRGPGHRTLADARASIDQATQADLRCPHCDLWVGDPDWVGMSSVAHDISACEARESRSCQ